MEASPTLYAVAGKVAAARRFGHPAEELERLLATEKAQYAIQKALSDAPPLSAEQKARLHAALDQNLRGPHE